MRTEASRLDRIARGNDAGGVRDDPDITRIARLIGDPAREAVLSALMAGRALTARELAGIAGVTPQTLSGHLAQLTDARLLSMRKQGRHRYYQIDGPEVAATLETLTGLAASQGAARFRPGPRDAAMRAARVCYDHLAGARAVRMWDSLAADGCFGQGPDAVILTDRGRARIAGLGIDLAPLDRAARPLCRACLDWSERRTHLAGGLGAALFAAFEARLWLTRTKGSRHVTFTPEGARAFDAAFPV